MWLKYGSQLVNMAHVHSVQPGNIQAGRGGEVQHNIVITYGPGEPQLWLSVASKERQTILIDALAEAIIAGQRLFVVPKRGEG